MHSKLALYGGTPVVPRNAVVPWPAPSSTHLRALKGVLRSGRLHRVNHPVVRELEETASEWTGLREARAVASCTAAIHIAVDFYGRQDQPVVLSALNWPGAAGPILATGKTPRFIDIGPDGSGLDEDQAVDALARGAGLVLFTHLFGNFSPQPRTRAEAFSRGAAVIDDCAQAVDVPRRLAAVGAASNAITLSGNGAKHLASGELGLLCSDDHDLIEHVDRVSLSSSSRHGERIFSPHTYGFNFRPNVLSAAIACCRFGSLEAQIASRQANSHALLQRLSGLPNLCPFGRVDDSSFCSLPLKLDVPLPNDIRSRLRDLLVDALVAEGVPAGVWLRQPVWSYIKGWEGLADIGDYPHTRDALSSMFYVYEVGPPNGARTMTLFADAFEKVWQCMDHFLHRANPDRSFGSYPELFSNTKPKKRDFKS